VALTEVSKYAKDKGVTLALQTHPEITGNNDETLQMLEEVGIDSLKVDVDLPLMESYKPEDVKATVKKTNCLFKKYYKLYGYIINNYYN